MNSVISSFKPLLFAMAAGGALIGAAPAMADVKAGVDDWGRGDFAAAVREWRGPAEKGDADAQFNLAQAYKLGRGVPLDLAYAEMLYAKAAMQGHLQASDFYGLLLYQRGQHAAAMPYIRAAADRGNASALYLLGLSYFNADTMGKDWVRAYALEHLASQPTTTAPGLPQAKQALELMDKYIELPERQKGISLASELATQIEANRNRQFAAADLGTPMQPVAAARTPVPMAAPVPARAPAPIAAPPAPIRETGGTWKLQLGAFGVTANADAQWAKVKARPEIAGHARLDAPTGKVSRLLATGYSDEAAHSACRSLAAAGIACLPVRD